MKPSTLATAIGVLSTCLTCLAQQPARAPNLSSAQQLAIPAPTPNGGASQTADANSTSSQPGLMVRIKDITSIAGHRTHQVFGFGLVTGLSATGGRSEVTLRFARNMLKNDNIFFPNETLITSSLSVVRVSAEIPPFLRQGEKFDVRVAVFDDATSLYNGNLEITELKGIDGQVYALAHGPIVMSGFSAQGASGGIQKNHVTVGSASAQLEVEICNEAAFPGDRFMFLLKNKDYATAVRIASEINQHFPGVARSINAGAVEVFFPDRYLDAKMDFVAFVNGLRIKPDVPARVVINQKTGTLVVGHEVRLSRVMFANSNLVITTSENPVVSQPNPFSDGQTNVVPRTQIEASEINSRYNVLRENPTVDDLATALNMLGVTPQDLIGIFQSLKATGSLQAELIVQ